MNDIDIIDNIDNIDIIDIYIYTYKYIHTPETLRKQWIRNEYLALDPFLIQEMSIIDGGHKTGFPGANLDEIWRTLYSFLRRIR